MDRFRWRIVRVDDQLVRVMQYRDPPEEWKDIFAAEPPGSTSRAVSARRLPCQHGAQVIDLEQYRARRAQALRLRPI